LCSEVIEVNPMTGAAARLGRIRDALAEVGLIAEVAVYSDDAADEVRSQLVNVDGVPVWVDPVTGPADRTLFRVVHVHLCERGVW
jgi:hypothetical protein